MHKYRLLGKKGEGTFSEVLKGQSVKTGKNVAIKCMKHSFASIEEVNNLREIQALKRLSPHPHIVKLHEVLFDQPSGRLALVFELMECNIYELIKGRKHPLSEQQVKAYSYQMLKAIEHMHKHNVFHRDIKPENLLVGEGVLKLADFGSCRGANSKRPFTEYISTRWYRAPECLLTDGFYGPEMDMWGVGCVIFEMLALFPLFPGSHEADQIERIHKVLGTPDAALMNKFKKYGSTHVDWSFANWPTRPDALWKLLPHASRDSIDLLQRLLAYDPEKRYSAKDALKHPWFADLRSEELRVKEVGAMEIDSKSTVDAKSTVSPPAKPNTKSPPDKKSGTLTVSLKADGSKPEQEPNKQPQQLATKPSAFTLNTKPSDHKLSSAIDSIPSSSSPPIGSTSPDQGSKSLATLKPQPSIYSNPPKGFLFKFGSDASTKSTQSTQSPLMGYLQAGISSKPELLSVKPRPLAPSASDKLLTLQPGNPITQPGVKLQPVTGGGPVLIKSTSSSNVLIPLRHGASLQSRSAAETINLAEKLIANTLKRVMPTVNEETMAHNISSRIREETSTYDSPLTLSPHRTPANSPLKSPTALGPAVHAAPSAKPTVSVKPTDNAGAKHKEWLKSLETVIGTAHGPITHPRRRNSREGDKSKREGSHHPRGTRGPRDYGIGTKGAVPHRPQIENLHPLVAALPSMRVGRAPGPRYGPIPQGPKFIKHVQQRQQQYISPYSQKGPPGFRMVHDA